MARLALTLTLLVAWSGPTLAVYVAERDSAKANAAYTASMLRDGYTTLLIHASDSALEGLSWANCNTLRRQTGVRAVVGLREPISLRMWDASGPEVAVREAMGDVAGFLAMTSSSPNWNWPSPSLIFDVDALAARPAGETELAFVTRVVQKSGDADIRTAVTHRLTSFGGGFSGNAIMLAPPGGEISTCVALSDIDRREEVASAAAALFPVGAGFGQQWALTNAERFDSPIDRYEHRASRWYWLGAVASIALAWTFSLWIQRGDLAVFSIAGLSRGQLLILVSAEMLVVVLGVALITSSVATYDLYARAGGTDFVVAAVREVARAHLAGFGVCVSVSAATATAISRRTLDALKDR